MLQGLFACASAAKPSHGSAAPVRASKPSLGAPEPDPAAMSADKPKGGKVEKNFMVDFLMGGVS